MCIEVLGLADMNLVWFTLSSFIPFTAKSLVKTDVFTAVFDTEWIKTALCKLYAPLGEVDFRVF